MSVKAGITVLVVAGALGIFGLRSCANGVGENYSTGTRVGVVQKYSSAKGIMWKSGEGTLYLGSLKGSMVNGTGVITTTWDFSCLDPELSTKIESLMGKEVKIQYTQWFLSPWWQSTDYNVVSVEEVK